MLRVKTRTEHISVSARCFRSILILTAVFFAVPCYGLSVSGIPEWLKPAVTRSLNAVWKEIPDSPDIDREATLALVATRLFAGYEIRVVSKNEEPVIYFAPNDEIKSPEIKINVPELRGMALTWFNGDIKGMDDEILKLVENLPQSSYTWSDEALKEAVGRIINQKLPGWDFSQQIYISDSSTLINITFRPSSKMILAVKPELNSRTVPVMFRTDLEAKLIPEFSPLIGIPVAWAERHKSDIEKKAREFLEDKHSVENLRANVSVNFQPGTTSNIEARVDSKNIMFQMWVAAYAGIEDRYPEIGAFLGYRTNWDFNFEFYTEIILSLNDFDVIHRLGGRFELFDNFWAGVENQWPGSNYFFRVQYNPVKIRRPYAWWRYSPESDAHEAALGYKIDEHISVELYYDNTGDDKFGLRGMWHL